LAAWRAAELLFAKSKSVEAVPSFSALVIADSPAVTIAKPVATKTSEPRLSWLTLAALLVLGVSLMMRTLPNPSTRTKPAQVVADSIPPVWMQQTGREVAALAISQMPGVPFAVLTSQVEPLRSDPNQWMRKVSDQLRQYSLTGEAPSTSIPASEPNGAHGAMQEFASRSGLA